MTKVIALRHMYSGSMFTIETVFRKLGFQLEHREGFTSDYSKFNALEPDILVVLGGTMGVYEAHLFPYLHEEIRILKERIAADKPTLGICLGSQLIAAAMGCRVYKGTQGSEYGFLPLTLTDAGKQSPLAHFAPELTPVWQMHGDTFDLPKEATLLAQTDKYAQAYRIGKNCFATQFHPEYNHAAYESLLVDSCGQIDIQAHRADAQKYLAGMEKQMEKFLLDLVKIWNIPIHA